MSFQLSTRPCTCTSNPPDKATFGRLVREFYEASGLRAYLGGYRDEGVSGDDDAASWVSVLGAVFARATAQLAHLIARYLMRAVLGELWHVAGCTFGGKSAAPKLAAAYGLDPRLLGVGSWYDADSIEGPCPECNPREAARLARIAYRLFHDLDWHQAYGGKAWAAIAEALLGRCEDNLVRLGQKVRLAPATAKDSTDGRCACCHRLPAGRAPKHAFTCECPDEGPDTSDANTSFVRDSAVFADYVLDLQHNTGSCLNKGWLNVDLSALKALQDTKRNGSVLEWGTMFPTVARMVEARRPVEAPEAVEAVEAPAPAQAAPAADPDADAVAVAQLTTPKGSTYMVQAAPTGSGCYQASAKLVGDTGSSSPVAFANVLLSSKAAAIDYVDGLAKAWTAGTTSAKAWVAAAKCGVCGSVDCGGHDAPTTDPSDAPTTDPSGPSDPSGPAADHEADCTCCSCSSVGAAPEVAPTAQATDPDEAPADEAWLLANAPAVHAALVEAQDAVTDCQCDECLAVWATAKAKAQGKAPAAPAVDPDGAPMSTSFETTDCVVKLAAAPAGDGGPAWVGMWVKGDEAVYGKGPGKVGAPNLFAHASVECPSYADALALYHAVEDMYATSKGFHPLRVKAWKLLGTLKYSAGKSKWPHTGATIGYFDHDGPAACLAETAPGL